MDKLFEIVTLEQITALVILGFLFVLISVVPMAIGHWFRKLTVPHDYVTRQECDKKNMERDTDCSACRIGLQKELGAIKTLVLWIAIEVGIPKERIEKLVE